MKTHIIHVAHVPMYLGLSVVLQVLVLEINRTRFRVIDLNLLTQTVWYNMVLLAEQHASILLPIVYNPFKKYSEFVYGHHKNINRFFKL
jgi:hypothetical protein